MLQKNEINVRSAGPGDSVVLREFNMAMALETESVRLISDVVEKGVMKVLRTPELGFYLVAECSGEIAGSLLITREWSDWRNGMFWWIQSVYVRPEYRRGGVFSALYDEVSARADADPEVCGLRLYVEKDNLTAQAAYRKRNMLGVSYRFFEKLKSGWTFTR